MNHDEIPESSDSLSVDTRKTVQTVKQELQVLGEETVGSFAKKQIGKPTTQSVSPELKIFMGK